MLPATIAAACLWAAGAHAQIGALYGRRVVTVEVAGTAARTTRPRDVGIPLGARLSRRLLRSTVTRLLETRRWANVQLDVEPSGEGVKVIATLVPRLILIRVDVVGNEVLDTNELLREVSLGQGAEVEPGQLDELPTILQAAYAERGYEAMQVEVELRDTDDPAQKVLILRVTEGEPTRVLAIQFDGDAPPPGSGVLRAIRLDEGDILDLGRLENEVRRGEEQLRSRGWLEARLGPASIQRRNEGVVLTIPSRIGPNYEIQIRDPEPLSRGQVYEALQIGAERLTGRFERGMASRVEDLYRRRGYNQARVVVRRVATEQADRAKLVVAVRAGDQLTVVARAFPGARHFDQEFLEAQMAAFLVDAIDVGSLLDPVDTDTLDRTFAGRERREREVPEPPNASPLRIWYPDAYERAVDHVRELYEADGFLDARVGPARLEDVGRDRSIVVVPVVEGPRALLYDVRLEGNSALGDREVLEAAGLEREQPFSYLSLEQAKSGIVDAYQDRGFFYAGVDSTVRFSGDRTRVELTLRINERFEVRVGEVVVRGNEVTNESLIRRVIPIESGDLLRPVTVRETQQRLLDLGVFSSVSVDPRDPDLAERVKALVITVVERKTQYLDFRAGISTGQGLRFGLEYGYRNLFGTAINFTFAAQVGFQFIFLQDDGGEIQERFEELALEDRLERRIALTFGFPYVGLPNVRASLAGIHLRENERNFGLTKNSVDLTFTWRPLRFLSASFSADVEDNTIDVLGLDSYEEILEQTSGDIRLRNLLRVPEGNTTLVAGSGTLSLDRRDNPFVPTKGFFASTTAEWARTLRTELIERAGELRRFVSHHLRLQFSASGYIPLGSRFVFATQFRIGRVVHLEDESETYPNRSFFVGGVDTVRGYLQDALIPQDLADEIERNPDLFPNVGGVIQGGDTFMVIRGELRFPITGDIRGGAFVDFGNLWIEPNELNPLELRPTAGLGLRIATPVGPIALDYGFLLARREFLSEPVGTFHFSIGLF